VTGELELDAVWQLDLSISRQIIEARFACRFLRQVPAHLFQGCGVRQPLEERVILSGPILLERLEPRDERLGVRRGCRSSFAYVRAKLLKEAVLEFQQRAVRTKRVRPIVVRQARLEPRLIPLCEPLLHLVDEQVDGRSLAFPPEYARHQPRTACA